MDRERIQGRPIDAAVQGGADRSVATAGSGRHVEGGRVQQQERRSVRSILKEHGKNAGLIAKSIAPFSGITTEISDTNVRMQFGPDTQLGVDVTDPDKPKVYLAERNHGETEPKKAFTFTPLIDFDIADAPDDETSVTLTPSLKDISKFQPMTLTPEGAQVVDQFQPGASFSELADDAMDAADVLRKTVPFSLLSNVRTTEEHDPRYIEVTFSPKKVAPAIGETVEDTTLVINLDAKAREGAKHPADRGYMVMRKDGNVQYQSLERTSTFMDGTGNNTTLVFRPEDNQQGRHQVELGNTGGRRRKITNETTLIQFTLTNPERPRVEDLHKHTPKEEDTGIDKMASPRVDESILSDFELRRLRGSEAVYAAARDNLRLPLAHFKVEVAPKKR